MIKECSSVDFAKLLFILDGYVNSILFLPSDISKEYSCQCYFDCKIHYEVFLDDNRLNFNLISENTRNNRKQTIPIQPQKKETLRL